MGDKHIRTRVGIKEIKDKCVDPHKEDCWSYRVIRPLSCYPTWACIKLGITANQVTPCNLIIGLTGCVLLALGTYKVVVIGVLLINLNYLLDRVDGNIAKTTNTVTKSGALLDTFSDYLLEMLIPICVGIGLYFHPAFGVPSVVYLLSGLICALFISLRHRIASFTSIVTGDSPFEIVKSENIILKGGLIIVALEPILLLVFALGNILSIFLFGYALVAICELLVVTAMAFRKAKEGK